MKHIKSFEINKVNFLVKGDYVICKENLINNESIITNFINNNVGKIFAVNDVSHDFLVQYEDIPTNLEKYFKFVYGRNDIRGMNSNEIKDWSKSKEELEAKLVIKKYNI